MTKDAREQLATLSREELTDVVLGHQRELEDTHTKCERLGTELERAQKIAHARGTEEGRHKFLLSERRLEIASRILAATVSRGDLTVTNKHDDGVEWEWKIAIDDAVTRSKQLIARVDAEGSIGRDGAAYEDVDGESGRDVQ